MNFQQCRWWHKGNFDDGVLTCYLCPRRCQIFVGNTGFCGIRKNINGELVALAYGRPVAIQVDPIEKKPLAEFMPGTKTLSIGTYGCNLNCLFCQNHHLSRGSYSERELQNLDLRYLPEKIIDLALAKKCRSIAFTYNEPLIWGEYIIDIAKIAKDAGLKTVLVSNGYISEEAAEDIFPCIDAANFDMKGFSEEFYRDMTGGSLDVVLNAISSFYATGRHVELTNLVIPGRNDSNEMIGSYLEWVSEKLDKSVPLHFSAYFPMYRYHDSPPTPRGTLLDIKEKARNAGFLSVYLGNIREV